MSVFYSTRIETNPILVCQYLLEKSATLTKITRNSLLDFIKALEEKLSQQQMKRSSLIAMTKSSSAVTKQIIRKDSYTPKNEEIVETSQQLFLVLADYLFDNDLTIYRLLKDYIFGKVIDGIEFQLIKLDHFYMKLEECGFDVSYNDQKCIENLIKPILRDNVKVDDIRFLLSNLGIDEKLPKSTKYLDYSNLKGPMIRIFNRIIQHIKKNPCPNNEDEVIYFVGQNNIEK
jgi:hypothetical protein